MSKFPFLHPGPLVDGELELVAPEYAYLDELLDAAHHPWTVRDEPREAQLTREQVIQFLQSCPLGHQEADPIQNLVPAYHFWMYLHALADRPSPHVSIGGAVSLRIGSSDDIELYYGHVGYHVYPPARGRHYAERAVRLLLPVARYHGLGELWITCNPDNYASRRTCERLGASLVETVRVPARHPLSLRGERQKCRYRLPL